MHKSDLLELQADELTAYVSEILKEDVSREATLSTVKKNKEKMIDLVGTLHIVYAKEGEEREEIMKLMRNYRKSECL